MVILLRSCLSPTLSTGPVANQRPGVPPAVLPPRIHTMAVLPERVAPLPDSPGRWTLAADASPWRAVNAWIWVSPAKATHSRRRGSSEAPEGREVALCRHHVNSIESKARHLVLTAPSEPLQWGVEGIRPYPPSAPARLEPAAGACL